jgi:hypothetical protein
VSAYEILATRYGLLLLAGRMATVKFTIPIKLPSLANLRVGKGIIRIKRGQREATHYCMVGKVIPPMPLVVTIVRVGPRTLDDDNLASACKHVRDQIAAEVGVDDGSPQYTWVYKQRKSIRGRGKAGMHGVSYYAVEVEIVARDSLDREVCNAAAEP